MIDIVLPSSGVFPLRLQERPQIVFLGDSNVLGSRVGKDLAFPSLFAQALGEKADVTTVARGGAVTSDIDFTTRTQKNDLTVIMLGSNDAAPRGLLGSHRAVPLARYQAALRDLVTAAAGGSRAVLVLAPPPVGSTAMSRRLEPYRRASRDVAINAGVNFIDPAKVLDERAALGGPALSYDALHLAPRAHAALAQLLLNVTVH